MASMHPADSDLVSEYEDFQNELNMEGISYPVSIDRINQIEKQNPAISINVFSFEDNDIVPLRIIKQKPRMHHINLLPLKSETKYH